MQEAQFKKTIAQIESIDEIGQINRLIDAAETRYEVLRRLAMPRAVIVGDVKPRYLEGCTGRVGRWISRDRREFFPEVGTAAFERGGEWRVTADSLRMLPTLEEVS